MHVGCSKINGFVKQFCFAVLVPTMHVGCSSAMRWTPVAEEPVLVPTMHVGCSSFVYCKDICGWNVLVPTMHVGCSSEICTKAVSLCSYFITMCCICQVLFPINFRFFILFFCSICFSSDFLVRIPLFHPSNRCENRDFRGTIFIYYFLI